jgi:hypothetical protein
MSKIALSGNSLGSGTLTISAPNTNVDRVLSLPDSTGTVLNDQSNIEAQVKTATNASGSAPIFSCRAWCNFDGTTSPGTIRASGNVSSVTRNGTGDYTVNFTTAMPDANYLTVASSGAFASSNWSFSQTVTVGNKTTGDFIGTYSTSSVSVVMAVGATSTATDRNLICVAIFR